MSDGIAIAGFLLVLITQAASTGYLYGKFKTLLNGTVKRVDDLEDAHSACSEKVNDRITKHVEHYHTGKK